VLDHDLGGAARGGGEGQGGGHEDVDALEAVEEFLANHTARLVHDVSYDDAPRQTGYAAAWRPHAHHYTILAVAAAKRDGELRVAATGVGPRAVRLTSVEQGGAVTGVEARDDALASAWYRSRLLPRLVERALADLEQTG
jgi:CO/xanthine dehydrogenase FAD-binding subunit